MIYKDEGIKGLYKGFYISLLCQASAMSFFFWQYFFIYLGMKQERMLMKRKDIKKWKQLLMQALKQAYSQH